MVQVFLDEDGRQIAQTELTLRRRRAAAGGLRVPAHGKGRHSYTVASRRCADEKIVENNQRSAVASVDEAGSTCCTSRARCGPNTGRWSTAFWPRTRTWSSAPGANAAQRLPEAHEHDRLKLAAIPTDQATINKFDVFIFGDLDSSYLRPQQQEMFVKRIRAGAGC